MKEFLCETQELAIGYGKTPLASGIALGANPGQILVLVGPNGAGKSTLLKTLAGQLAPLGGTVLLDGQDLTAYTSPARSPMRPSKFRFVAEMPISPALIVPAPSPMQVPHPGGSAMAPASRSARQCPSRSARFCVSALAAAR